MSLFMSLFTKSCARTRCYTVGCAVGKETCFFRILFVNVKKRDFVSLNTAALRLFERKQACARESGSASKIQKFYWTLEISGGMSVCVCVCVCARASLSLSLSMPTRKCVCMYVCIYTCIYVCMYRCVHVCVYAYMYVCIWVCMFAFMDGCMSVCLYVCTYACMYIDGSPEIVPQSQPCGPTPTAALPMKMFV